MKSIYILTSEGLKGQGGISRMMSYFTEAMDKDFYYPIKDISSTNGIRSKLRIGYLIYAITKYFFLAMIGKVALIHINLASNGSTYTALVFSYISKMFGIPVIYHLHGCGFKEFYEGLNDKMKNRVLNMFHRSKRILVLGKLWEDFFVGKLGISQEQVTILPNAIPSPNVGNKELSKDHLKFLFLGEVGVRKRVEVLIRAFGQLTGYNWKLIIAGNGDLPKYQKIAEECGITEKMEFTGWLGAEKVQKLLDTSDVFILPSSMEIHPMAIIEAMANKLSVITTPVGVISEFATHEENCLISEVDDIDGLANEVKKLIENPLMVRKLGDAGYNTFVEKFEIKEYNKKMLKIYSEILEV